MSTYDGAYSNRRITHIPPGWASPCTCDDDKANPFCAHHGKDEKEHRLNTEGHKEVETYGKPMWSVQL